MARAEFSPENLRQDISAVLFQVFQARGKKGSRMGGGPGAPCHRETVSLRVFWRLNSSCRNCLKYRVWVLALYSLQFDEHESFLFIKI